MAAILKVKDENGNWIDIPAIQGDDYVLTEADKQEIAEKIETPEVDLTGYATEQFVKDAISAALGVIENGTY